MLGIAFGHCANVGRAAHGKRQHGQASKVTDFVNVGGRPIADMREKKKCALFREITKV